MEYKSSKEADNLSNHSSINIAILIPCYNEEHAIAKVVKGFQSSLPSATIYVYDNNCTDKTSKIARQAGAIVRYETRQGKGHVVRRMFADIEADVYIMVDGDGTYDATYAPLLVETLLAGPCDMVTAIRDFKYSTTYEQTHTYGTKALASIVNKIFRGKLEDMFSGYRAFSRRFVKSFPMVSTGFEIETELTIHALELQMKTAEIKAPYFDREPGSTSKLRAFRDGFRVLFMIIKFIKEERPLQLFASLGTISVLLSIGLGIPLLITYLNTGLVPRIPTAILSSALMLLGFLGFIVGFILSSVTTGRRETKRLSYLKIPPPTT